MSPWATPPSCGETTPGAHHQPGQGLGGKLLLVKDSYGNAIAPFLAANYSEVHVADFRSFPQDLPGYCQENGITDVLFFNNVMSANTYSQVETMDALFH